MQEAGALEAAAVAVEADDDGAEAADQDRGPVHLELLRHRLATWDSIPVVQHELVSLGESRKMMAVIKMFNPIS